MSRTHTLSHKDAATSLGRNAVNVNVLAYFFCKLALFKPLIPTPQAEEQWYAMTLVALR